MLVLLGWSALVIAVCFWIVATGYVAVIHLKKLRKEGKRLEFWIGAVFGPALAAWLVDILFMNFVVATVAYVEWPRELTMSSRIERHYRAELVSGKPRKFTTWWKNRLNEIDPIHITPPKG